MVIVGTRSASAIHGESGACEARDPLRVVVEAGNVGLGDLGLVIPSPQSNGIIGKGVGLKALGLPVLVGAALAVQGALGLWGETGEVGWVSREVSLGLNMQANGLTHRGTEGARKKARTQALVLAVVAVGIGGLGAEQVADIVQQGRDGQCVRCPLGLGEGRPGMA